MFKNILKTGLWFIKSCYHEHFEYVGLVLTLPPSSYVIVIQDNEYFELTVHHILDCSQSLVFVCTFIMLLFILVCEILSCILVVDCRFLSCPLTADVK